MREVWALYIVGMTVLTLRFAIRFRTVGIRGLKWDDMFALLVVVFYTIDAATVDIVCTYSSFLIKLFLVYFVLTKSTDHAGSNVEGVALAAKRRKYMISTDSHVVDIRPTKISHLALTDAELDQMHEGSKQQLLAWYSYSSLVWCLKGTMVCFFMRMTAGVASRKSVVWIGYACIVTYVAVELTVSCTESLLCCPRRVMTDSLPTDHFRLLAI